MRTEATDSRPTCPSCADERPCSCGATASMDDAPARGLEIFRFSTTQYRAHERVAAWREVFGRTLLHIDIAPRSTEGFQADALIARSSSFGLLHASASATDQANSRSLIVNDDVTFGIATTSPWGASQLGRTTDLQPGGGALMSNSDVGAITLPNDCRYLVFSVPRSAIETASPTSAPCSDVASGLRTRHCRCSCAISSLPAPTMS